MWSTYNVGIGSFVDVGGYCFRHDYTLAPKTAEDLQADMSSLRISSQGFGCPDRDPNDGEASMTGLLNVGTQHETLGFTATGSDALRVVLMSTDDFFKLGPDGDNASAPGQDTGCTGVNPGTNLTSADHNSWGEETFCSRIPSVPEVKAALETSASCIETAAVAVSADTSACAAVTGADLITATACDAVMTAADNSVEACTHTPPIHPVFAVAGYDTAPHVGVYPDSVITALEEGNAHRLQSYRNVMDGLGYNSSKFVLELKADSSDFVEIAVIALRQVVGDLPDECLAADECVPGVCGAPTCVEIASVTGAGVAADTSACAAVTGADLTTATACDAVMTAAENTTQACTHTSPSCYDTPYGPKSCSNCPPGFAPDPNVGGSCTLNIDECCSSPCQHDGQCTDGTNGYTCDCTVPAARGWEGVNCAVDTNECSTAGCQNGASCASSNITDEANLIAPGEFECHCVIGYSGDLCDVDINECASDPCENRGSCSESNVNASTPVDAWICSCEAGFSGESCGTDIDECASIPW